jgi:hypothetical protein
VILNNDWRGIQNVAVVVYLKAVFRYWTYGIQEQNDTALNVTAKHHDTVIATTVTAEHYDTAI